MITIKVGMNRKTVAPGYFILNSDNDFTHISTTRLLTDGNMNLGGGNKCWCQIFDKVIICIKNFLLQKNNPSSCGFRNFPICY